MSIVICEACSCTIDLDIEDDYAHSDDGFYLCPRCAEKPSKSRGKEYGEI